VNRSRIEEVKGARDQAKSEGRAVRFKNGMHIKPTDPAVLQELMDRVKAKQTQAVSIRIPLADLDAAKKIAEKIGIGYQTVFKDIIHEGLKRAS
jgi:predicted DNA binding CopG/RHH family protein